MQSNQQAVDELAEYRRQTTAIRADVAGLSAITEAQFGWRPAPGRWSVGECLTHLNQFGQQVAKLVAAMLQEAKARGLFRPGPYRHPLLGNLLLRSVEPPYKLRVKAVKRLVPMPAQPMAQVLDEFHALQGRLEALLTAASGVDLAAVRRPLPPTNLRLTIGQWLALCLAHERRHLWQAAQIRTRPGFPR